METGRIENGFYVQGDLKFAVGTDKEKPHAAFDAVDALSNEDKKKFASLNNILCQPFNKQALTTVLKYVVQNAWYMNNTGTVPTEVLQKFNTRLALYTADLNSTPTDFLAKKTRAVSTTKPSLHFQIDGAKYEHAYNVDHNAWRGQRYLVIATMVSLQANAGGKGVTIREILDNIKETRETAAPTRNGIGQIVNLLCEKGLATCLNPQDAKAKPVKGEKAEAAKPAPAKHSTPATPAKKKH